MSAGDDSQGEALVQQLLADYVTRRELGEAPEPSDYEPRLPSAPLRQRFRELVQALDRVEDGLPTAVEPGTLVGGRYRIVRELGKGGMGCVMLAHDENNERNVALKLLRSAGARARSADLLRRERKALARLHHPHIVTFLDAQHWRGCSYLVMELVDGANMADVLDELRRRRDRDGAGWRQQSGLLAEIIGRAVPGGRQDLLAKRGHDQSVAAIVAACASALECAHAANVVHRDLKPGNILLVGGGNPVLLDFGLAGLADASRGPLSSRLFGTASYLAPEQARSGRMGTDTRSDIYKLGAILYELLTLRGPFDEEPVDRVVAAVRDKQLPRARTIDPAVPFELDCICARATAGSVEDRYQTAGQLRLDLERYLDRRILPDAARAEARWPLRCAYFARRHGIALALVVLVAVTTMLLLRP
jgi:serine/threonine protein kinase